MNALDEIRAQIGRGDIDGARHALGAYLQQHRGSVAAWSLLADLVSDPAQLADCYRHILDLDPGNAEAADAVQRLAEGVGRTGTALRCPRCGGKTMVRVVGELKDKRATCQHCGTEVDLPDVYRRVERQHREERHLTHTCIVDGTVIETRGDYAPGRGVGELVDDALTDWWAKSRPSGGVVASLKRSLVAGVFSLWAYGAIVVHAHLTEFNQVVTRLLALGPGALILVGTNPGAFEVRIGQLPVGLLSMNAVLYCLIGALPALATRRVWLVVLLWIALAAVGMAAAWLALVLIGGTSPGGPS